MSDAEIDRLFAGRQSEDGELEGVARFLHEVECAYPEQATATHEEAHVAAMLETAKLVAENNATAAVLDQTSAFTWRRGRAFAFKNLAAHKWATAAVLSAICLLAFGGAAYAGVLPAPIQEATSALVRQAGISIPKANSLQGINNGVRDWGAALGNGKGQGGTHRNLSNPGQGRMESTGTVDVGQPRGSITTSSTLGARANSGPGAKSGAGASTSASKKNSSAKKSRRVPANSSNSRAKPAVTENVKSTGVEGVRATQKGSGK